jgi:hypothetical protein
MTVKCLGLSICVVTWWKRGFKKRLIESKGLFPILYHHDPTRQIGWNVEGYEDERELFVPGLLDVNVTAACDRNSFKKMTQNITPTIE